MEKIGIDEVDMVPTSRYSRMTVEQQIAYTERLAAAIATDEDDSDAGDYSSDEDDVDYVYDRDASDAETEGVIETNEDEDKEEDMDEDERQQMVEEELVVRHQAAAETAAAAIASPSAVEPPVRETPVLIARDGSRWSTVPPPTTRTRSHCFVRQTGGPSGNYEMVPSPLTLFKEIFTCEMRDIIIRESNRKMKASFKKYNTDHPDKKKEYKLITEMEFNAWLGLLLAAGVSGCGSVHTKELWGTRSLPIFRATMSLQRFWTVNRFVRLDNQSSRAKREK